MNVELSGMKIRGNKTNERDLGFEANASLSSTRSRRSGRKSTMNQTIATTPAKMDKLSAADFFFRKGGGSQSDDEGNVFSDDEDVTWASGNSKRSMNSVIAPKISKIDDDDIDFFSEAETDSESVSKKEEKKKKKTKDKASKGKKKSKDKKSKKKKPKDKKKEKHDMDTNDLCNISKSSRCPMDPDGVKLSDGVSASPVRKPKKSVMSVSEAKTKDEPKTSNDTTSKSEKKGCKCTKSLKHSSDRSKNEKKEKTSRSTKRSAGKAAEPKTHGSSKGVTEKSDDEKVPKSSKRLVGQKETTKRDKSLGVKSTDTSNSEDKDKTTKANKTVLDFNASFVDLSTSQEERPETPTKHRRSTTETSKRGRRSLSRGRADSRVRASKQDDSILQSPEKSSTSSTEITSSTSQNSSWGDFGGSTHRARTIDFPGDLVVSPDCAKKEKKSVGKAFELDSFADLQNSFTDFQSSSTEFNANFESDDVFLERTKEEAKRQMLDQSRKGPVRVRVSIRRRNRDPASPGSKPKPLKPITVPTSSSKKDELTGTVEPPKEGKAQRRPSLDDHFGEEPKFAPSQKNSSATIHGGGFSPANVDNYVSSSASLPDIRKKKNAVTSPKLPNRGVLHREDSANRLRSTQDLAGVVDEFLRSGRQPAQEESSDLIKSKTRPRSKSVGRKTLRRNSSGHSLLAPENQALDKSLSSIVRKTPRRRSSTGKLLGVGKKGDLLSPRTVGKAKRRLSFGRSLSKFRHLDDDGEK